jgi:hypothetical protein
MTDRESAIKTGDGDWAPVQGRLRFRRPRSATARGTPRVQADSDAATEHEVTRGRLVPEEALNQRLIYEQLCATYRAIDDFRAKLLGFLPLVTGGSLALLISGRADLDTELFLPAGVFGVLATLGLFAYEIFGIKKCHALIRDGARLEATLRLTAGQFQGRPDSALRLINEPFAAAVIYPAVLAAWTYLAALRLAPTAGVFVSIGVFLIGLAATLLFDHRLKNDDTDPAGLRQSRAPDLGRDEESRSSVSEEDTVLPQEQQLSQTMRRPSGGDNGTNHGP